MSFSIRNMTNVSIEHAPGRAGLAVVGIPDAAIRMEAGDDFES